MRRTCIFDHQLKMIKDIILEIARHVEREGLILLMLLSKTTKALLIENLGYINNRIVLPSSFLLTSAPINNKLFNIDIARYWGAIGREMARKVKREIRATFVIKDRTYPLVAITGRIGEYLKFFLASISSGAKYNLTFQWRNQSVLIETTGIKFSRGIFSLELARSLPCLQHLGVSLDHKTVLSLREFTSLTHLTMNNIREDLMLDLIKSCKNITHYRILIDKIKHKMYVSGASNFYRLIRGVKCDHIREIIPIPKNHPFIPSLGLHFPNLETPIEIYMA